MNTLAIMKSTKMRIVHFNRYGSTDVLELGEVEKPTPKDDEVLIKVRATTVTAGDCELRAFKITPLFWLPVRLYIGVFRPRIPTLGQELAGEIEAVGKDVTSFKVGDAVFAGTGGKIGTYLEYKCQRVTHSIALKPTNMSFEEAATIPTGGLNAIYFMEMANIKPGESILINGAGGSIGSYAVQMAKSLGAVVTAVDTGRKLDMLLSIGADKVIDYKQQDFTQMGITYDVIFDVAGKCKYAPTVNALKEKGRYIQSNPSLEVIFRGLWTKWTSSKRVLTGLAGESLEQLAKLKEMIEAGKLKSVIDKRFTLDDIVAAQQYVEAGHKSGNVIVVV